MLSPLVVSEIAVFAERFSVPVDAAIALPSVFDEVAEIGNRPLRSVIAEATYRNTALGQYIKEVAVKAVAIAT